MYSTCTSPTLHTTLHQLNQPKTLQSYNCIMPHYSRLHDTSHVITLHVYTIQHHITSQHITSTPSHHVCFIVFYKVLYGEQTSLACSIMPYKNMWLKKKHPEIFKMMTCHNMSVFNSFIPVWCFVLDQTNYRSCHNGRLQCTITADNYWALFSYI